MMWQYHFFKQSSASIWHFLEHSRAIHSILTPLAICVIGLIINSQWRYADEARVALEKRQNILNVRQSTVESLSRFIYERRARSELLASALMRNARYPIPESMKEVVERKQQYDDAYVNWNENYQANLLQVRQILGDARYEDFKDQFEGRLVEHIFTPLDTCLTDGYDLAIRNQNPKKELDICGTTKYLNEALDCGHVITDQLFLLSAAPKKNYNDTLDIALSEMATICP